MNSISKQNTIHVVEDDEAVRESLQMLLESVGYHVITYNDAINFLDRFSLKMTGCLILDIRMPGIDGMTLQSMLVERNSLLPIIVVTGHGDIAMAVEAMKLGAFDFIQKPYREQALLEKISGAVKLDIQNRDSLKKINSIHERIETLTPREFDVLKLLVEGQANKMIANSLEISQRTVEIHRKRVMEKMEAKSVAHLVRLYLETSQN